ncbi:MAG: VanZ family protein [Blautia massiliensis (ex Durand et al. 2017)]
MGTSFVIELLQLITCRGLFEFDDIIHNGFGCMMGAVWSLVLAENVKEI